MMMREGQPRLGFRARLRRGWNITKLGMHVVRADPELMVYTFLSGLFSIGAAIFLLTATGGIGFFTGGEEGAESGMLVGMFLTYMVVGMITVFWNAAIIASAYERITTGSNPSFSYGIKEAAKRLPAIIIWGLISGTVGLIVGLLEGMAHDDNGHAPLHAEVDLVPGKTGDNAPENIPPQQGEEENLPPVHQRKEALVLDVMPEPGTKVRSLRLPCNRVVLLPLLHGLVTHGFRTQVVHMNLVGLLQGSLFGDKVEFIGLVILDPSCSLLAPVEKKAPCTFAAVLSVKNGILLVLLQVCLEPLEWVLVLPVSIRPWFFSH